MSRAAVDAMPASGSWQRKQGRIRTHDDGLVDEAAHASEDLLAALGGDALHVLRIERAEQAVDRRVTAAGEEECVMGEAGDPGVVEAVPARCILERGPDAVRGERCIHFDGYVAAANNPRRYGPRRSLAPDFPRQILVSNGQRLDGKPQSRRRRHRARIARDQPVARAGGAGHRPGGRLPRCRHRSGRALDSRQAGARCERRCGSGEWPRRWSAIRRSGSTSRARCTGRRCTRSATRGSRARRSARAFRRMTPLRARADRAVVAARGRRRGGHAHHVRVRAGCAPPGGLVSGLARRGRGAAVPADLRRRVRAARGRAGAQAAGGPRAVRGVVPVPIVWEAPAAGMVCRREDVTRALPTANPEVAVATERLALEYLARLDRSDIVAQVRTRIRDSLPAGTPTQAEVARALALSARTLAPAARGGGDELHRAARRDAARARRGVPSPHRLLGRRGRLSPGLRRGVELQSRFSPLDGARARRCAGTRGSEGGRRRSPSHRDGSLQPARLRKRQARKRRSRPSRRSPSGSRRSSRAPACA